MPFDWKTPKGYLLAFTAQAIAVFYYVALDSMILLLFGGLITFSLAFISDIQICLNALNNDVVTKKHTSSNILEMKMLFRDTLEFHAAALEFVRDVSKTFSKVIVVTTMVGTLCICGSIVLIDMSFATGEFSSIHRAIDLAISFICIQFVFCYFGDQITTEYYKTSDIFYDTPWHLYPYELRKHIPFVLQTAQRPVNMRGFGNIICTLPLFKQVNYNL